MVGLNDAALTAGLKRIVLRAYIHMYGDRTYLPPHRSPPRYVALPLIARSLATTSPG